MKAIDNRTIYAVSFAGENGRAYFTAEDAEQVKEAFKAANKPFEDVWEIDIAPVEFIGPNRVQ